MFWKWPETLYYRKCHISLAISIEDDVTLKVAKL
jgi:hypothetical protein